MDICNSHDEGDVCYESVRCPACEIEKRMQSAIDDLDQQIIQLKEEIEELNNDNT